MNQLVIVTGTSSGIGKALAQHLLDERWEVVGLSRRAVDMDNARYRHVAADLADLSALKRIGENELGPLVRDGGWQRVGLVNNAGVTGVMSPLEEKDVGEVAAVFAVNVLAPMYLMGLLMRAAPPAAAVRIVNVSTGAAVRPLPGASEYGGSKAGLRMAGMVLGEELSDPEHPGRRRENAGILSYEPGVVDTAMQASARAEGPPYNRRFVAMHEQGALAPPEGPAQEIAEFLGRDRVDAFMERRYGE